MQQVPVRGIEASRPPEGRWMRAILFVISLGLFSAGTYVLLLNNVGAAATAYGAGVLSLVFVYLSRFRRFKGFGIEAELLERRIAEADVTIEQLKSITLPIAEMLFTLTARIGRWGSALPHRDSYRLMEKIESELQRNGVGSAELESAKANWHHFNLRDLAVPITMRIGKLIQEKQSQTNLDLQKVPSPTNPSDPQFLALVNRNVELDKLLHTFSALYSEPDFSDLPEKILRTLQSTSMLSPAEKDKLLADSEVELGDLKYYRDHGTFRSLERWFRLDG
jgi:hypothetical protein